MHKCSGFLGHFGQFRRAGRFGRRRGAWVLAALPNHCLPMARFFLLLLPFVAIVLELGLTGAGPFLR